MSRTKTVDGTSLRACYAMPGTGMVLSSHALARRCAVLNRRMQLRGRSAWRGSCTPTPTSRVRLMWRRVLVLCTVV
eukprot:3245710-Rhodomonas_salina.3